MKYLFIALLSLTCAVANAAPDSTAVSPALLVYGTLGTGNGTDVMGAIVLNVMVNERDYFSLAYTSYSHPEPAIPADYAPGLFNLPPQKRLGTAEFCYGRVFHTAFPRVRFVLKGGVVLGASITPKNFVPVTGGPYLGPNYTYTDESMFTAGILLNPVVEFPISRHFGFTLGLRANLNPAQPAFLIDGGILLGKVRERITHYPPRPQRTQY